MELDLTEDQELFRDTTTSFLDAECGMEHVRALDRSPAPLDRGWWQRGAELGWTSLLVPEELDGGSVSGDGLIDLTIVARQVGTHVAPGPLLPVNVVAAALARSGSADQRRKLLPGLLAGETVATWALAEPHPHAGLGDVQLEARPDGDGFVLTGAKFPVEAADDADWLLVTARSGDGLSQLIVPAGADGLSIRPAAGIDLVRRHAEVTFDGVRVGRDALLGPEGGAADDVERQLQIALVIQVAEMTGAAERAFDFSLEWVENRYSFGRPISSYQEIKHRFADMKLWLEASHAITEAAARAVQAEAPDAAELVSAAKAYVGEHVPEIVQDCVQMHGGIGVTYEADVHIYLRRVTQDRMLFGTPDEHRERLVTLVARD